MKTVTNTLLVLTTGSFITGLGVSYVFALIGINCFYIAYQEVKNGNAA